MTLTVHQVSVPVFVQHLEALAAILDKAAAHCAEKGVSEATLLQARMAPDMYPLVQQVQIATDHAKGATARMAGVEVPKYADDETSFAALKARVGKTVAFVKGIDPKAMEGSDERQIKVQFGQREVEFKGSVYLLHAALPNFYFHVTTAYDLLRQAGLEIGKRDFMGTRPEA